MKLIPYGRQEILQEDIDEVVKTLKSDFLTQGPKIAEFEKTFSGFVGSRYSVAVCNGTAALHLSMLALGIGKGDSVLTTPNTFVASANSALYVGAKIDFCDINPENYLLDLDLLEMKISSRPKGYYKAIVTVHFAGYPTDMERLGNICEKHGILLIEDACHALGAEVSNSKGEWSKIGSCQNSQVSCFSFHPVKHIAAGEGGMITTNDPIIYEKLKLLRTHGIRKDFTAEELAKLGGWYYEMVELGFNYRMPDLNAALANSQMKRIEENIKRRSEIAAAYDKELLNCKNIKTPRILDSVKHGFHLYVIRSKKRDHLYWHLREKGIHCQVLYIPVHTHPYYINKGFKKGDFPISENYYSECLALPMFHSLTNEQQNYVINVIKEWDKV